MDKNFLDINKILVSFIIILISIVLFTDSESLNSLFIHYENDLVINEVGIINASNNVVTTTNTSLLSSSTTSQVTNLSTNVATTNSWIWPTDVNYVITTYYSSGHKALDIYNGYGSNIYAANTGVVTMVKTGCVAGDLACNGRGGNYIVIKHNQDNYYTVYMHLLNVKVNVGDTVSRGQVIATMGNTGNVEPVPTASSPYLGTHLHFCLYVGEPFKGGYAINPMNLY